MGADIYAGSGDRELSLLEGGKNLLTYSKKSTFLLGVAVFVILSWTYFSSATCRALHDYLWMDEVLAVTAARQPTLGGVWDAIWAGTDFSPPTLHFMIHLLPQLDAHDLLAPRLVSMAAGYAAAVCCFLLVRPQTSMVVALIAFAATLCSGLFDFAVQARQYALLTFLLALALLLWSKVPERRARVGTPMALWLALAASVCLHFYGIVTVAAVGCCELLWTITNRRLRWSVWAVCIAILPVLLSWLPLAKHLSTINSADQLSSNYYAHPTIARFIDALEGLLVGDPKRFLFLLAVFVFMTIHYFLFHGGTKSTIDIRSEEQKYCDNNVGIVIISLIILPFGVFMVSQFVTGSFSARYASGVTLLPGIATAMLLARLRAGDAAVVLFPVAAFSLALQADRPSPIEPGLALLSGDREPLPVVVGDGQLYIELNSALSDRERSRLTFVARPDGAANVDPTNENEIRRLSSFSDRFKFKKFDDFIKTNPDFYLLYRLDQSTDPITPVLVEKKIIGPLVAENGHVQLFRAGMGAASGDMHPARPAK